METFGGVIGVIFTAVVLASLFYFILKVKGPWGSFWTFFLVLFFSMWAASLWISPMGPVYWGIAWVPLLFIGLLVALLLATVPKLPRRGSSGNGNGFAEEAEARKDAGIGIATLSGVFWMFMVILMLAVVIGYTF